MVVSRKPQRKGESLTLSLDSEWFKKLNEAKSPFFRPFVTSDDLTSRGTRNLPRWIIDTEDLSLEEVKEESHITWEFLVSIAEPVRTPQLLKPYKGLMDRWWQLWNHRAPLYRELRQSNDTCLVVPFVAKHVFVAEVPSMWVFTNKLCVIRCDSLADHMVLLSNLFEAWVRKHGGTMGKTRNTLSLAAGVQTFPTLLDGCASTECLVNKWNDRFARAESEIGESYTAIWNAFHDPIETREVVRLLRSARSAIDEAVIRAYGWDDIDVPCEFVERNEGIRYTISEPARREVLQRLLKLNHERYEEEVKQGLHDKKKKKATRKKKAAPKKNTENTLFDME